MGYDLQRHAKAPLLKQRARNRTSSNGTEEQDKIMQYVQNGANIGKASGRGFDRASPTSDDACTSNVATLDTQSICT